MKYYVGYRIKARFYTEVEADSIEEAMQKADENYIDADFGVAEDIDGEQVVVEDEDGNYVWEK